MDLFFKFGNTFCWIQYYQTNF